MKGQINRHQQIGVGLSTKVKLGKAEWSINEDIYGKAKSSCHQPSWWW